jgi:hypothetical protein
MKDLQAQRRPSRAAKKKASRAAKANKQDSPTAHNTSVESPTSSSSSCAAYSPVPQQPAAPHRGTNGGIGSAASQHTAAPHSSSADATSDTSTAGADQQEQKPKKQKQRKRQEHICACCGGKGAKRCSVCYTAWYCGEACQTTHWSRHKQVCSPKQN